MRAGRRAWWWAVALAAAVSAADTPVVDLDARAMELRAALETVASQLDAQLVVQGTVLPPGKVDLVLRRVTPEFALGQVLAGRGLVAELATGRLVVRPRVVQSAPVKPARMAQSPPPPPEVPPVPPLVVAQVHKLLWDACVQPADEGLAVNLGWALRAQRPDWREPLRRALSTMVQAWSQDPDQWLAQARVLARAGEGEAAGRMAAAAANLAAISPASKQQALAFLARVAFDRGDHQEAWNWFRRLEAPVQDPAAAAVGALARYELGEEQEALGDIIAAETRWPRHAAVMAAMGELLRRDGGNTSRAVKLLQRAVDLAPDNADALFGVATLTARETAEQGVWEPFLAAEPFTPRAARVRLGVAVVDRVKLTERGGQVWRFSLDGERVMFSDAFHNQLQVTDVNGFGLAVQFTDQEAAKSWASWSPDESWIAWVSGSSLYLQKSSLSGTHHPIVSAEGGRFFRRTTWSPDGKLLLFTDWDSTGRQPRVRCWSLAANAEVEPPERLRLPGLGDVDWLPDDWVLANLTVGDAQTMVLLPPKGAPLTLCPPAPVKTYVAPSVDVTRTRVAYYDDVVNRLLVAAADAASDSAAPVLGGQLGYRTAGALWSPRARKLAVALRGAVPMALTVDGAATVCELRTTLSAPLASGPKPPTYRWQVTRDGRPLAALLSAAVVADDGREVAQVRCELPGRGENATEFTPADATPGLHWLRVVVSAGGQTAPPRWYRYQITG